MSSSPTDRPDGRHLDNDSITDMTPAVHNLTIRTPVQRARSVPVPQRTPTAQTGEARQLSSGQVTARPGLSASARGLSAASITDAATPHARRAIEVYKGRRTAIFNTPGRRKSLFPNNKQRRASHGPDPQKDAPFDALRHLSRRLAPQSARVVTSSSPAGNSGDNSSTIGVNLAARARDPSGIFIDDDDDDEHEELLLKRPRLSLPIDAGDDDEAELLRPETRGIENLVDDDYSRMSIERPRRNVASRDISRMSDFFANGEDTTEHMGLDDLQPRIPIPPPDFVGEGEGEGENMESDEMFYERFDSPEGRRETLAVGRQSDFGSIHVPVDADSPFRLDPVPDTDESFDAAGPLQFGDDEDDRAPSPFSPLGETVAEGKNEGGKAMAAAGDEADVAFDMDIEPLDEWEDESPMQASALDQGGAVDSKSKTKKKPTVKLSKYGIPCPSLPPSVVKRLAETMARTSGVANAKISPETLQALAQATEWFFEQVGGDLRALAHHAGRKTIEQSDVITLMKRQRQIDPQTTVFSLAQRHLPRELLQELRMPARGPPKKSRKAAVRAGIDDDGS